MSLSHSRSLKSSINNAIETLSLRRMANIPFIRAEFNVTVAVSILPGKLAPRDPSTTSEVQTAVSSLSQLLGSESSESSASVVAATGPFLAAAGTSNNSVTIVASAPSVSSSYAYLPSGITVASATPVAAGGAGNSSPGLAVIIGSAFGGIVACAVIGVGLWLLVVQCHARPSRRQVGPEPGDASSSRPVSKASSLP